MKKRARPGQTLIEVVMATMISAITTTAVFSVLLSSFVSDAKADKRDAAAMVLKRAQETLRSYVSAVPTDSTYVPSSGSLVGRWAADSSGAWALRDGTHDISSLVQLPPLSPAGGPQATLSYTVSSYDCGFGIGSALNKELACKTVTFTLTYAD